MEHTPKRGTCDDCEVNWDRKGNVKTVVLCPLHTAAPALLEALETLTPPNWSLNDPLRRKYANARAAIKLAKGD